MRPIIQAVAAINPRTKPPQVTTQVVACPVGMIGTGDHQQRSVTGFNYGLPFTWEYGPWESVNYDCQVPIYTFTTPLQEFDPPLSGGGMSEGQEQTYGPVNASSGPYTITLTYHVYVTGTEAEANLERVSNLTIVISPIPSGTYNIVWDRDYATFPDKAVDPSGTTTWLAVPNDEWTANDSQFTVTLTVNV